MLKTPIHPKYKEILELFDYFEVTEIHRFDKDYILATIKIRFKNPNSHPKDLGGIYEHFEVICEDNRKKEYIIVAKHYWHPELNLFLENHELLLDLPIIMDDDHLIEAYITDSENIDVIIKEMKKSYQDNFKILSITSIHPSKKDIPYLLTERQKEIVFYAVEKGYYEIPRKINIIDIAKHFEISKTALAEHLRKVERTIFESIFK